MVEWKKLGEVCTFNRGRTITAKDAVDGGIPVIAGGQVPSYYHNEANRNGESITVAGSGAYAPEPATVIDSPFLLASL